MSYSSQLLIAAPALADPNFRQTVVLVLSGGEETFGVILNRQSEKPITELWEQIFETPCRTKQHLYLGGPVFGPLIALHTAEAFADAQVLPGLYVSSQKESLEAVVGDEHQPFRLYVGGAGWGKKQLQAEIQQGAWFMTPATIGDVFDDPTELWRKTLDRAGRGMLASMLHQKRLPDDPTWN
ncbi:MAG: YqgE/AlgH family protein [Planctomycetaceae bacterium]|nr:YqgE/AlgH family protein [Planctomycetaceae bacterium]